MEYQELYDELIAQDLFTREELDFLMGINGTDITIFDVADYYRYGVPCALTLAGLDEDEEN